MIKKMFDLWEAWCKRGAYWPFLHDPVTHQPSVTLIFPYITFVNALASVIALHFYPKLILATMVSIMFWAMAMIFYMIRKLTKAKIDLQNKSIDLSDDEKPAPAATNTPAPEDG